MTDKILLVDDEPQLLQAVKRQLRKRFNLITAESGQEALQIMKDQGPFAVIISDMRMPGMDGIQLLSRVKEYHPETVRMMLTGNADQETAAEAVNKGQIFRFLNKPCPTSLFAPALALAIRQYRLMTMEKELLDKTLNGSINVLAEILSLANATAFSSGYRIKMLVRQMAEDFSLPNLWQYEISALMSQIGCITVPSDILHKRQAGVVLTEEEKQMFNSHPETGERLVKQIPRLEKVGRIIGLQLVDFKELELMDIDEEISLGTQILRAALTYDLLRQQGLGHKEILQSMVQEHGAYDPEILALLARQKQCLEKSEIKILRFQEIVAGMITEEDVMAKNGALLILKGQEITWPIIQSLSNFEKHIGIVEPIRVRVPVQETQANSH